MVKTMLLSFLRDEIVAQWTPNSYEPPRGQDFTPDLYLLGAGDLFS